MTSKLSAKRLTLTTLLALGLSSGPAVANHQAHLPYCKFTGGTNACLWITPEGIDLYRVHIGIDISMGADDVQSAINTPINNLIRANLVGKDGDGYRTVHDLGITIPVQTNGYGQGRNGYGANFSVLISGRRLDEDNDGRDELAGQIVVTFPRTGSTVVFETGQINHTF